MTTRLPEKLPELPIETLSDQAWLRVEQRVFAALTSAKPAAHSGAWPRAWFLAASAASLLLTAAWLRGYLTTETRYVTRDQSQLVQLAGVELRIQPESSLSRAGAVWTLERGAAEFRVAPRKHDPLTVQAAQVRVEVVGTLFRVERQGDRVRVETREGTVRVIDASGSQLVAAGEHWPSELPGSQSMAETRATPPLAPADAGTATESASVEPMDDARADGTHPKRASRDAAAAQRQRFEHAAALEAHEPDEALRIYRGLSQESGAWASNALFALARLEVERGLATQAARDLRRYVQRYPSGLNRSDARALLSKLQRDQRALIAE